MAPFDKALILYYDLFKKFINYSKKVLKKIQQT